jgi:hypothetical protein
MKLNERAVLASLSMGQWRVMVKDRELSQHIIREYNVARNERDIVMTTKSLIMKENFAKVRKAHNDIRTFHYAHTLSWSKGFQILPSKMMFEYMDAFRKLKARWEEEIEEFVENFEEYKEIAKIKLNGVYKESDYPSQEVLRESFYCELSFLPVPESGDFRVDLDKEMLSELKIDLELKLKTAEEKAKKELWNRLYEVIQKMAEALKDPDKTFRDTKLQNITKLTGLLTMLNFADDPELEIKRQEIEGFVATLDPQSLRDDKKLRAEVAKETEDIMESMKGYVS